MQISEALQGFTLHIKHMGTVYTSRNRIFPISFFNISPSLSCIFQFLIETWAQAIVHTFLYYNHSALVFKSLSGMAGTLNGKAMTCLKEVTSLPVVNSATWA